MRSEQVLEHFHLLRDMRSVLDGFVLSNIIRGDVLDDPVSSIKVEQVFGDCVVSWPIASLEGRLKTTLHHVHTEKAFDKEIFYCRTLRLPATTTGMSRY